MNQLAWLIAWSIALLGCQRDGGRAPAAVPAAYRQDIDNLCDAVARSGAAARPAAEHPLLIAQWLGANLTTDEAHQFLVKIQPLEGEPKAAALEAEATRIGLPGCALAGVWRAASEPTPRAP